MKRRGHYSRVELRNFRACAINIYEVCRACVKAEGVEACLAVAVALQYFFFDKSVKTGMWEGDGEAREVKLRNEREREREREGWKWSKYYVLGDRKDQGTNREGEGDWRGNGRHFKIFKFLSAQSVALSPKTSSTSLTWCAEVRLCVHKLCSFT